MTSGFPDAEGARLDAALARVRDTSRAPALRAALYRGRDRLWSFEHGDARQFRIGSITKTFTAAAVLRLHERGVLDLDRSLGHYLSRAPYAESVIRDLLSHRSGMTAEPTGPWWERTPGVSWAELAAANSPPTYVHPPSVRYHYSNLGFALLGRLVEEVAEMPWFEVVSTEFLEPLGLTDTTYAPGSDAATGTSRSPLSGQLYAEPAHDTVAMAPAGQLWSTTEDLARWGHVLLGLEPLLSAASLAQMSTCHAVAPTTQHLGGYGLGLRLRWRRDGALIGHTGSMPGFLAALFVRPDSGGCAVVLANVTTGIDTEQLAADLLDPGTTPRESHRSSGQSDQADVDLGELVGAWYWGNTAMRIEVAGDGFDLVTGPAACHFRPTGPDCFVGVDGYYAGETLTLGRRTDGQVDHLEVVSFVFTRTPYDREAPIPGGVPVRLDEPGRD